MALWLRRWWPLGAALIGLGAWSARLESAINGKADAGIVAASQSSVQAQLTAIQNQLSDIAARQRQYFCAGKADYCR